MAAVTWSHIARDLTTYLEFANRPLRKYSRACIRQSFHDAPTNTNIVAQYTAIEKHVFTMSHPPSPATHVVLCEMCLGGGEVGGGVSHDPAAWEMGGGGMWGHTGLQTSVQNELKTHNSKCVLN